MILIIYALLLIPPSTIIHNNIKIKINNERHRSFLLCTLFFFLFGRLTEALVDVRLHYAKRTSFGNVQRRFDISRESCHIIS
jgi:hypothetical protein